jgi:hypothetical protein
MTAWGRFPGLPSLVISKNPMLFPITTSTTVTRGRGSALIVTTRARRRVSADGEQVLSPSDRPRLLHYRPTSKSPCQVESGLSRRSVVEVSPSLGTEVVLGTIHLLTAVNHLLDEHDRVPPR